MRTHTARRASALSAKRGAAASWTVASVCGAPGLGFGRAARIAHHPAAMMLLERCHTVSLDDIALLDAFRRAGAGPHGRRRHEARNAPCRRGERHHPDAARNAADG